MWEIWANSLLPQALKSCPKSNKSPNLVTLFVNKNVFKSSRNGVAETLRLLSLFDKEYQKLWKPLDVRIFHDSEKEQVLE